MLCRLERSRRRQMMSVGRRVIVIGGSIAGLFVAAFLRRAGWQVDIYERSSVELIGRGVGIFASHLELFEALDKCGAASSCTSALRSTARGT
jgi:2-polyprenyl-6-methoxyphenol hydroxylase-like FAD-dependent oxidoreductase